MMSFGGVHGDGLRVNSAGSADGVSGGVPGLGSQECRWLIFLGQRRWVACLVDCLHLQVAHSTLGQKPKPRAAHRCRQSGQSSRM